MRQISFKLFLFLASIIIFSCSDPSVIGSELLSEDQANLEFSDQIPISGKSINGSIVQTYSPFTVLQLGTHLVGNYEDVLFGKSEASIYTQIALGTQARPEMDFVQLDSIILSLAYDSLGGGYGDLSQTYGLEVLLLEEDMENISDYFSDQTFLTNPEPIGSIEFIPSPDGEPVMIREYISNDTLVSVPPHIRIPLNEDFGEMILRDTLLYLNDTFLLKIIKGIHIQPTVSSPGILSIDFNNAISRISLYYTSGRVDKVQQEYRFVFNQVNARVMNLSHDYEGSMVEQFQKDGADSLIFMQGMTGVNSVLSFPDLSNFQNIVVNKAELELTVASASFDEINPTTYPPPEQIIITTGNNGENDVIIDVRSALFSNNPLDTDIFGGIPIIETQNGGNFN